MKALPTALLCSALVLSCGVRDGDSSAAPGPALPAVPSIRFAYCWTKGFTATLEEFRLTAAADYTLIPEPNSGIQHRPKILIDVSSKNLPDVFTFWSYGTNLKYFVDNGLIVDIQEIFDASPVLRREDFHSYALEATEFGGRNYAIPYEWFFGVFLVNAGLLDRYGLEPPETWEDILAMTPVLRSAGIVPISMGSYQGDPGHLFFSALAYQGKNGYRDARNLAAHGNFVTEGNLAAAEAALALARRGAIPEDTIRAGSWDHQIDQYNKGAAAMTYTFNWNFALVDPAVAAESVIIPVPRIPGAAEDSARFTVGGVSQSICVSAASWKDPAKRERIVRFLEWLLSDETFILRTRQEGCFPAKKVELPRFDNPIYEMARSYARDLEVRRLQEFYFGSMGAFDNFKEANDLLWSASVTAGEFLDLVQAGLEAADE